MQKFENGQEVEVLWNSEWVKARYIGFDIALSLHAVICEGECVGRVDKGIRTKAKTLREMALEELESMNFGFSSHKELTEAEHHGMKFAAEIGIKCREIINKYVPDEVEK